MATSDAEHFNCRGAGIPVSEEGVKPAAGNGKSRNDVMACCSRSSDVSIQRDISISSLQYPKPYFLEQTMTTIKDTTHQNNVMSVLLPFVVPKQNAQNRPSHGPKVQHPSQK